MINLDGTPCKIQNSDVILCDMRAPYIMIVRQTDREGDGPLSWSLDKKEAQACFRPAFLKDEEDFKSFVQCLAATHNMKAAEPTRTGFIIAYRLISNEQ